MIINSGKKVLIIHNILWSHYKAKVFSELYEILLQNNYKFFVIQIALNEKSRKRLGDIDLSLHKYPFKLLFESNIENVPLIKGICRLTKEIFKHKPDILIIPGYSNILYWIALFIGKFILRSKIIVSIDSTEYDNPRKLYKEFIKKIFIKLCNGAFCYGTKSREYTIKLGMKPERVITRCQATDNKTIENIASYYITQKENLKIEEGFIKNFNFLYVGRLSKEKNVETLIKAFRILKTESKNANNWGLIIVGDGDKREYLMDLTNKLNVQDIYFVGGKSWKEVIKYYILSDVFILPSISEPWGLVVNEAMVCGLPVIVSNRAGSAYDLVVEGQNGFTFPPLDEEELYNKMLYFVENPDRIKLMGRYSKNIISKYTHENAAEQMYKGIRKICEERS